MFSPIKFLSPYLIKKYKGWKATGYKENQLWFKMIAKEGQKPSTMVISCCDARIHVTSIFGSDNGEFFIHRNIANLVPPYNPNGDHHGTSAALEYAITKLRVSNIIIMGHSKCGGIINGYNICKNKKNISKTIFIDKWLKILKPAFLEVLKKNKNISDKDGINNLEKESILVSINNLIEFPFIKEAIKNESLSIHGIWHDIGSGSIESFDPILSEFKKI
jgi:carbonic anhydrase